MCEVAGKELRSQSGSCAKRHETREGGRTEERWRKKGDERNVAASFNPPDLRCQLQNSYKGQGQDRQGDAALGLLLLIALIFLKFPLVCLFFKHGHPSLLPLRSRHLSPTVLRCGSLTCRVTRVFAVVYKQDVTAIGSNPICFQIRAALRYGPRDGTEKTLEDACCSTHTRT